MSAQQGRVGSRTRHAGLLALVGVLAGVLAGSLVGCISAQPRLSDDPLTDLRNPSLRLADRVEAVGRVWEQVQAGVLDRVEARRTLDAFVWSRKTPERLRLASLQTILGDESEKGRDDARRLVRLLLPREPSMTILSVLCATAATNNWTETTPALVRSLSRVFPQVPDERRPERLALQAMHGGTAIERIVFDVFLSPVAGDTDLERRLAKRTRGDAWGLLWRLDRAEAIRTALVGDDLPEPPDEEGRRILADLRASASALHLIPRNGAELDWLGSLRDEENPANAVWWSESAAAIAGLSEAKRLGLSLRHVEPIRWVSRFHPEWLEMSRGSLLGELERRLASRKHHERSGAAIRSTSTNGERLGRWSKDLRWGDLLSILVIDEAIRDPQVVAELFRQAGFDRADNTTEYGGVLESLSTVGSSSEGDAQRFRVVLYAPRPSERPGDNQFVASRDMIRHSDRALAHYHFHAQRRRNSDYAGPSDRDYQYADRYARACVVLTSIRENVLGADYYQPGGATIDLGEIRR